MASGQFVPDGAVDRPELRARLDAVLHLKVGLLVAQAGSGKSVLLSQWIASHPEVQSAWMDVGPDDNDPIHFIRRLLDELATIAPGIGNLAHLAVFGGGGLGSRLIESVCAHLSEENDVVVVFDDVHSMTNPKLLADLERLTDISPTNVHVIFASRSDFPIALNQSRARGESLELRGTDLALSRTEAAEMLSNILERPIEEEQLSVIFDRTEGWAAGLQLVGMTLRIHPNPAEFVQQFDGTNRMIADYLTGEVLEAMSPTRREILLRIATLNRLSRDLVSSVLDDPYAGLLLDELARQSMFLVPLDDHDEWYRLHPLVRDLLRFRLRVSEPDAESQLLIKAAKWQEQHGNIDATLEYLLRAEQWSAAVSVVLSQGPDLFEQGRMRNLLRWLDRLPENIRANNVELMLLQAMLEANSGNLARSEGTLARVVSNPDTTAGEYACAQCILASLTHWRPHPDQSRAIADRALDALASTEDQAIPNILGLTDSRSLETLATIGAGQASFLAGDLPEARIWLTKALLTEGAQYPLWRAQALGSLSLVESWSGRSALASDLAAEALTAARDVDPLDHPATGDAYLAMAMCAIERGDPGNASIALHEGRIRAKANGRTQLVWIAHLELALLHAARGEVASSTLPAGSVPPAGSAPPVVEERLMAMNSRVLRLNGSARLGLKAARQSTLRSSAVLFEQAACALTIENLGVAVSSIASLAALPDADEPLPSLKRILLRSWLAYAQHDKASSARLLIDALEIGELNNLVEVFVRAGPIVLAQIAALPSTGSSFHQSVISRAMDLHASSDDPHPLSDDLTGREREILQYLPTRLTAAEIAERCYVSTNTVKTHVTHIYRKLDVADRRSAIERATELGLV